MKTIPPPCPEPDTGPKYWRSLDQLAETPEFRQWVEREFPAGASELTDPQTRRHFMKIMSASFLLAGVGLSGCRRPEEHIYPFSKLPEGYVHGVEKHYATSMPSAGGSVPLLVNAHDGRPTKIEGNPSYPGSNGGTDVYAQASILNLYDTDRATQYRERSKQRTKEEATAFLGEVSQKFLQNQGDGLSFLVERSHSPSRLRLQKMVLEKFPKAGWHVYDPVDSGASREAARLAFGERLEPRYRLDRAQKIVSLDCDFLGSEPNARAHIQQFADGRRLTGPNDPMNRLYVVEPLMTVTGTNADHRLRAASSSVLKIAAQLAVEVISQSGADVGNDLEQVLTNLAGSAAAPEGWARECAKDLIQSRGQSVVMAGSRQPVSVHLIAHAINVALGNVGQTVSLYPDTAPESDLSLQDLVQELNSGVVDTLVILGGNPVYNAPADLEWRSAQRQAGTVIRLGYYDDETSELSTWHFPGAHYLESWGDGRTADGMLVPVQPLIAPLFAGMTELEFLARIAGEEQTKPYDIVRATFAEVTGADIMGTGWKKFLHDGFWEGSPMAPAGSVSYASSAVTGELSQIQPSAPPSRERFEVVFHRDYAVDDGRYNNNGWLLEMPDPVTKISWDKPFLISRRTAAELGVENEKIISIALGGRTVNGPVWIQPGMADFTIAMPLGYGRSAVGRVGRGVGVNVYPARTTGGFHFAPDAKVTVTGETLELACTQDHFAMEGRPIVRELNLEEFRKHPNFVDMMGLEAHAPDYGPLYEHPYRVNYGDEKKEGGEAGEGMLRDSGLRDDRRQILHSDVHQWGMSIDLTTCVGCSACVIACQSENNVPIVGKDQVRRSREMHWMRIDRYFSTSRDAAPNEVDDELEVVHQPMLCQHCESAPCESVCPVNATIHDEEGLNLMVYNRCVGTRYCSNNCPYKVRRFNFFDYNKRPLDSLYQGPLAKRKDDEWELLKLVRNPSVSVRMRGVMEKCTFCVQRIEKAKIAQKVKARASGDVQVLEGAFTTACAQACPAGAIVFGNLQDPNSKVSKLKKQQRDYNVLGFLGTLPRLTYLARIRNPNKNMPDYHVYPLSFQEYSAKSGNPFEARDEKGAH